MKRITVIGLFVGLLSLTMNAQFIQPSSSNSGVKTQIENQKKPDTNIAELLARYESLGKQAGSISQFFTKEEQRALRLHFAAKKSVQPNAISAKYSRIRDSRVNPNNSMGVDKQSSAYGGSSNLAREINAPAIVNYPLNEGDIQAEIMADRMYRSNNPVGVISSGQILNRTLSDIIPTVGTTESFSPEVGDHFFDPGGPGGSSTEGDTGNYPNCGCDTQTTLLGVSEIEFQFLSVFSTFDYLKIYDGTDASGVLLYDNSAGTNSGDITLADMIASNGSATFTSTSGNFFFFFHASSVVDYGGWDVLITEASGGGGGGGNSCAQTHPFSNPGGASGSSVDSDFKTASDIVVVAGDNFTLETIEVPFLSYAPEDPPITATVVYYEDNGGFPGTIMGSETVVPTIISSEPWANPVAFQFKTSLELTPFVFSGDASVDKTYWIEISMGTATNQATVFWEYTDDIAVEGSPLVQFDASAGAWSIPDAAREVIYTFNGQCEDNGGGGGGTFPDPYCGPLVFTSTVEPITLVSVAGINNVSDATLDGSPAHEDFTTIEGDMEAGDSYPISLQGNTAGGFTNRFAVFIDWNQNGVLDDAGEVYEITETILGSTGEDGQEATGMIDVPADAMLGATRMRVKKMFGSTNYLDPCMGAGYGQAEDYTINVTDGDGGGGTACSQNNPENAFENGFTSSQDGSQIIATDINVPADTDFTLNSITVNVWTDPGQSVTSADIAFYENLAGVPGTLRSSQLAVAPISQTVIGTNFGYDISEVVFDITPEVLEGQVGSDKIYWVSIYMDISSGSGFLGSSSVIVGEEQAYSVDGGITWNTNPGWDTVYLFDGDCEALENNTPGPLTTVYGINNDDQDLIGFGTGDPQNAEVFGTSLVTSNFENAGAINPANPTTGYVLDNTGQLYSFDVTTGFYTSLGTISGEWIGMEFDQTTGILYGVKDASLYTIDIAGLSSTLIGALGLNTGDLPISLAIDGAGIGYVHEIVGDLLYSVDLATGTATVIGDVGFDANYGQGMCYDPTTDTVYMSAFNSGTFMSEWRSVNTTTGMSTLIGPITTVNDPDPQVGWSSVGETLDPPSCAKPTFLTVTDITETTAELSWTAEPNAANGYIWYVFDQGAEPQTATPVATGTTPAGTTNATATGLENAMSYDFYVVADCNTDGLSAFAGPINFGTVVSPPACGGKFFDTGGPNGNYDNNENVTTVISPDAAGDFVTVTFTMFNVEATWDALYVYDGPDANSPIISSGNPATNSGFPAGGYYGTEIPGPFSSTHPSGALTFVFMSESSFNYDGWEADVTCAMFPPPNDKIVNSINVGEIGFPYTDPMVRMPAATTEDGNPVDCDLTGANGVWYHFTTSQAGTATANIVTPAGASNVTFYTAPSDEAVETDLMRVQQSSNPCMPGISSNINLEANQTYYVFVMNSGAVTDIQIDATTIGIADTTLEGFSYYPNPTNGVLNLNSKNVIEMVSIYNLLGQKIIENSLHTTTTTLDISTLSTGTYVMKVTVNGQTGTYKLLKQ